LLPRPTIISEIASPLSKREKYNQKSNEEEQSAKNNNTNE